MDYFSEWSMIGDKAPTLFNKAASAGQ